MLGCSGLNRASAFIHQTPREAVRFEVTREDFEVGCAALFDRCMLPISRLLEDLGETWSGWSLRGDSSLMVGCLFSPSHTGMERRHVDEVVLVGGSTRVPKVKRLLR